MTQAEANQAETTIASSSGALVADSLVEAGAWPDQDRLSLLVRNALDSLVTELGLVAGQGACEVSIVFTDDAAIQILNRDWRSKDKPTNVLSFPAFEIEPGDNRLPVMLGDVIIAHETVTREAGLEEKTFEHHVTHLMIHGILHLLGYDHETDEDAEIMEAAEIRILARLSISDPYAETGTFD